MIKVGDMVCWYEKENMEKKYGQVIYISNNNATIFSDRDKAAYIVPLNKLTRV